MSKDGRIGNRELLKTLGDLLKIEGVSRMPSAIDRDLVHVQTDLNQGGFSGRVIETGSLETESVAGVSQYTQRIYGERTGAIEPLIKSNIPDDIRKSDARMLSIWMALEFDAAGALAFNGKNVNMTLEYATPTSTVRLGIIHDLFPWITVATAIGTYVWAAGGSHNDLSRRNDNGIGFVIWAPVELALQIHLDVDDGTNFPANTTVSFNAAAAKQFTGGRLPI